jgi:hypothetical protein
MDEPTRFTFDAKDNLYVSNSGNSTVTQYVCCNYDEAPNQTFDVDMDVVNELFTYLGYVCVVNGISSNITCFNPPYASTHVLTSGLHYPGYAVVDRQQNLVVSNCCTDGHIAVFSWPWFSGSGGNLTREINGNAWPLAYVP